MANTQRFNKEENMNLDRIIAVRTNKTVYRDGEYCVKVFDDDFSKVEIGRAHV